MRNYRESSLNNSLVGDDRRRIGRPYFIMSGLFTLFSGATAIKALESWRYGMQDDFTLPAIAASFSLGLAYAFYRTGRNIINEDITALRKYERTQADLRGKPLTEIHHKKLDARVEDNGSWDSPIDDSEGFEPEIEEDREQLHPYETKFMRRAREDVEAIFRNKNRE